MPGFQSADGLALSFEITGNLSSASPPVLMLAGLTRNREDFQFVVPHLSSEKIILLDSRGRGASEWGPKESYTVPQEAADVITLLDHLDIEKATILGTSRGGLIALLLAMMAPERLAAVIFNDIGPEIDLAGFLRIADYVGRTPGWRDLEEAATALQSAHKHDAPGVSIERWRAQARAQFIEMEQGGLALRYDPALGDSVRESLAQTTSNVDLWQYFDALPRIPIGVIRGKNSDILSLSCYQKMKARRPDIFSAEVSERGHVPFLDEAESLDVIRQTLSMLGTSPE